MDEDTKKEKEERISYWQVFYDDTWLLFFLSAAITLISYTVWGLIELGSATYSPFVSP